MALSYLTKHVQVKTGFIFPKQTGVKINIPSQKLTLNLKIGLAKMKIVYQPSIFRCYDSSREGNYPSIVWFFRETNPPKMRTFPLELGPIFPLNHVFVGRKAKG